MFALAKTDNFAQTLHNPIVAHSIIILLAKFQAHFENESTVFFCCFVSLPKSIDSQKVIDCKCEAVLLHCVYRGFVRQRESRIRVGSGITAEQYCCGVERVCLLSPKNVIHCVAVAVLY